MPKINVDGKVREMTAEEVFEIETILQNPSEQIERLKMELSSTDYKAIKYAEGWIDEKEYAPIKAKRQAIREKINILEAQLGV